MRHNIFLFLSMGKDIALSIKECLCNATHLVSMHAARSNILAENSKAPIGSSSAEGSGRSIELVPAVVAFVRGRHACGGSGRHPDDLTPSQFITADYYYFSKRCTGSTMITIICRHNNTTRSYGLRP